MAGCRTCDLLARRDAGDAPLWDQIARTPSGDVVHAMGTSVEGWLVLVVRRHITAVADLDDEEAASLGPLIRDVSRALQATVGCSKTYVVQFAEHRDHPHVHVHVIPRAPDLPDERQGPRVFSLLGLPADQCVPEERMDEIAAAVRAQLG
jgi:diadenosine tetraphosphate (Ap4A) HIT family hydrolase